MGFGFYQGINFNACQCEKCGKTGLIGEMFVLFVIVRILQKSIELVVI